MHPNEQLIIDFYTCFQNLDIKGMKQCYHPEAHFSDPAFPNLNGTEIGSMWAMLLESLSRNKGKWQLTFRDVAASDSKGSCHWEAYYVLSSTGRDVHNAIEATFKFKDGKILDHVDEFDFYRWARMGFGFKGVLIGWMPFFRKMVQKSVKQLLHKYIQRSH